jgi:hypothetical protein
MPGEGGVEKMLPYWPRSADQCGGQPEIREVLGCVRGRSRRLQAGKQGLLEAKDARCRVWPTAGIRSNSLIESAAAGAGLSFLCWGVDRPPALCWVQGVIIGPLNQAS